MRQHEVESACSGVFERLMGITLFVLAVALVVGILVALFR